MSGNFISHLTVGGSVEVADLGSVDLVELFRDFWRKWIENLADQIKLNFESHVRVKTLLHKQVVMCLLKVCESEIILAKLWAREKSLGWNVEF